MLLIDNVLILRTPRSKDVAHEQTLEERLDELSQSMQESAELMEEVQAELDARAALVKKLKEEAQDAEALAVLPREQVEATRRMMDSQLDGTVRGIRKNNILIGIVSFAAGGCVTLVVTILVHMIS
jgi:t-SNARE complex subunit (syntaxin)